MASEPTVDNTDFGDLFSWSEDDRFGDMDLLGLSGRKIPFWGGFTSLRGYGCIGFLFGRGGGISMAFTEFESPVLDSRTTYIAIST